ncbi:MAG: hypothetical protein ACI8WB_003130 [Phenylobacterium sp.]|jgi:hypothetical protein
MKYPLGIQTFSKIIEGKMLYIDKTAILYDLLQQGSVYFLSRPRRFGKSLLITTLEALFSGQKALFNGLAIADTDYDFTAYPVIKMEFTKVQVQQADDFKKYIIAVTNKYAEQYDIQLDLNSYEMRFDELVSKLHKKSGKNVVLLIDEYDKPILSNLNKPALADVKEVMNAFYSVVKSLDESLQFVFITGVSKFAKVSVFSGMNNLSDISMDSDYATLCGITQQELESYFADAIDDLVVREGDAEPLKRTQMLEKIKYWYNGYCFEEDAPSVYNPYSLLSLFSKKKFKNYWFTTATPTFLLNLLQDKQYDLRDLSQFAIGESAFAACEPEEMDVLSLLVQTGYLSIKGYNDPLYVLDFPNYEVKRSFYDSVAARYAHVNTGLGQTYTHDLCQYLNIGNLDGFFKTLQKFFANIPYDIAINQEKYYQSLFYAIFTLLGLTIDAEVRTNVGRIDCVLQTNDVIYIIEFKLNDSKEAALKQIEDKQYAQKYQNSGKDIVLLGVEFDQDERNIGEFIRLDLT